MKASERFKTETNRESLFNLCPVGNVANVFEHGLFCHKLAASLFHDDFSDAEVQGKRAAKTVVGGKALHEYANLYFDYRNPMFFRLCREGKRAEIALLAFDCSVLDLPGCLVADRNAASDYATFLDPLPGLELIRFDLVYAGYWVGSGDPVLDAECKSIKNAEALIPELIPPSYIRSVFVYNEEAKAKILHPMEEVDVAVRPELYF